MPLTPTTKRVFEIRSVDYAWGDYGDILVHGMVRRENGILRLERAAPFFPPVTLPNSDIVVTSSAKEKLTAAIPSLVFKPVIKKYIVDLDWHLWDVEAEDPLFYPESGEPEDFIWGQNHDQNLADELEDCHELIATYSADIKLKGGKFNPLAYNGEPYIRCGESQGKKFVSGGLKAVLEEVAGKWLGFYEVS